MRGFLRYLTITVASAVLMAGFIANSARIARAEDEAAADGTEPAKATPLDFEGCWSGITAYGYLNDNLYGAGYGYMYITQTGKKFVLADSFLEFVWYNSGSGEYATGYFSGKASSTGFMATAKYKHGCKLNIRGDFGGDGIEGTYKATGCGKTDFHAKGTFTFPSEPSYYCDYFTP
jgi:hypothetical protein